MGYSMTAFFFVLFAVRIAKPHATFEDVLWNAGGLTVLIEIFVGLVRREMRKEGHDEIEPSRLVGVKRTVIGGRDE